LFLVNLRALQCLSRLLSHFSHKGSPHPLNQSVLVSRHFFATTAFFLIALGVAMLNRVLARQLLMKFFWRRLQSFIGNALLTIIFAGLAGAALALTGAFAFGPAVALTGAVAFGPAVALTGAVAFGPAVALTGAVAVSASPAKHRITTKRIWFALIFA
jgi:glucose-6-phosphate-specific signal transduction histidine kinase